MWCQHEDIFFVEPVFCFTEHSLCTLESVIGPCSKKVNFDETLKLNISCSKPILIFLSNAMS